MKIRAKDGQTIDLAGLRVLHERNCATCAMSFCMEKLLLDALESALSVDYVPTYEGPMEPEDAAYMDALITVREAAGMIKENPVAD